MQAFFLNLCITSRIHISSKDAQLKILNILYVNDASFYKNLHFEYFSILKKLMQYYQDYKSQPQNNVELKNFSTDNVEIPNVQLDLKPIFVNVNDIKTCERLIDLILQLLSVSISINSLDVEKDEVEHRNMLLLVLDMLENYNVDIKLACITFFNDVIDKSNKLSVTKFHQRFPEIFKAVLYSLEAMVTSMPVYYEKCEVDAIYLGKFTKPTEELLRMAEKVNENELKEVLSTVCAVILNAKYEKIFSRDLKLLCLSMSSQLELPAEVTSLKNKDFTEIACLKAFYFEHCVKEIAECQSIENIQEDELYKHLFTSLWDTLQTAQAAMPSSNLHKQKYIILYHFKRANAILSILESIYVWSLKKSDKQVGKVTCENTYSNLQIAKKIYCINKGELLNDTELLNAFMDLICRAVLLTKGGDKHECSMDLLIDHILSDDALVKSHHGYLILKSICFVHIVCQKRLKEKSLKVISHIMKTLSQNKTADYYKQVIIILQFYLV